MSNNSSHLYSRTNPFVTSIKDRYCLCQADSQKNTQHVVLDLRGSGITYTVGDSIGIYPQNDPTVVEKTLQAMRASGDEVVLDKHTNHPWKLQDFLTKKANIATVSRKLLSEIHRKQSHPPKKQFLDELHHESQKEFLKEHLEARHLWDILLEHGEVLFPPQELCNLLMPLLPRLYSISSSQKAVGDEVHLTVALLEYQSNDQYRRGVCTHYLCELAPVGSPIIPVYIHPHNGFTVPENGDAPIIMIGPGTGVAPFRAFMQERILTGAHGSNWLFFGERNRASNFFYESYWNELVEQDKLRIDLAFSRDQDYKVYVQHRMLEHGKEFFRWLESGAFVYVCGDAHRMAKDVEIALLQIIQEHGRLDEMASKHYLKKLRAEKRYVRDVY